MALSGNRIDRTKIVISDYRNGLGDLTNLARSIETDGLIHPILLSPRGVVLSGVRRIAALDRLGKRSIPFETVDNLEELCVRLMDEKVDKVGQLSMRPSEYAAHADLMLTSGLLPPTIPGRRRKSSEISLLADVMNRGEQYASRLVLLYRTARRGFDSEDRSIGHMALNAIDDGAGVIPTADEVVAHLRKKYPDLNIWYGYLDTVQATTATASPSAMSLGEQRSGLRRVAPMMKGMKTALEALGAVNDEFPRSEAIEHLAEAEGLRASLTTLIRQLRGVIHSE